MNIESDAIKKRIVNDVICDMSRFCNKEVLCVLENVLYHSTMNITFSEDKMLPSTNINMNDKILQIYLSQKSFEIEESTVKAYRYYIKHFFNSINMDYRDVNNTIFFSYLNSCRKTMKNSSISNVRRIISIFYDWCINNDYYSGKNPCKVIKKIKCEKKIKSPLSDEEIERLRDTCVTKRELALVDLMLSTGLRREEIANITLSDMNFTTNEIRIFGKGAKERIVYVSTRCRIHLLDYLQNRGYESQYLFCQDRGQHNKITKNGICAIVRNLGKRANIQNCQVHRIRKWFASDLKRKGCDIIYIQKLLGHESIETTKRYYVTIDQEIVKNEHSRFVA